MNSLTAKTHGKLRRFWDRIEGRKAGHKGPELFPADDSITTQDVYRYRKQRGVNLGIIRGECLITYGANSYSQRVLVYT